MKTHQSTRSLRSISRLIRGFSFIAIAGFAFSVAPAAPAAPTAPTAPAAPQAQKIEFEQESLDNGMRVIYAPMHNAPVVHVRVVYHVGSKDEKPDRQGFAHMFEHMMFRGSAHVAPEEHMKRIGEVGGNSNASTNYDLTTYVNTIPSQYTEMALYLEADRMASFKVSDEIFRTERKVVSEEWRLRTANPPYGAMSQDLAKVAYKNHNYRWTTIGDMDQLRQASSSELQEFYNKYYVPNNACLVIAGEIDVPKTKEWVHKYFGWIPKGDEVKREIPVEQPQTEARRMVVNKNVPLPSLLIGFHTGDYRAQDQETLDLLSAILGGRGFGGGGPGGGGQGLGGAVNASRLNMLLVSNENPLCISVNVNNQQLDDPGLFTVRAQCLSSADPAKVEEIIRTALADVAEKGVTDDELTRVKTNARVGLIRGRETCTQVAAELGMEEVLGGDAKRANETLAKIDAVSSESIQAAAKKYLKPENSTTVLYWSDPNNPPKSSARGGEQVAKADAAANAPVAASDKPIKPRVESFPANYPTHPPTAELGEIPTYAKGNEFAVNGVRVVVMPDHRLPLVSWSLIMRAGSDSEPKGKEGLGALTAQMLRRGTGKTSYRETIQDLESRGIQIDAVDASDNTRINGSCTVDQLDYAIDRTREILRDPAFPEDEFRKSKLLMLNGLRNQLAQPASVATRELTVAMFGDTVLGRQPTAESLQSLTLDDVKKYYAQVYQPYNAIFVISGDVDGDRAKVLAGKLLDDWKSAGKFPAVDYTISSAPTARRIILVDNPDGKQSTIRMAVRAYDVTNEKDKYAGILATQILSSGIDSRLGKYVRAEKGFTYGVRGTFVPARHSGEFDITVDTNPDTTGPCIEACEKVLQELASNAIPITPQELADAKSRAIGGMIMDTQTIAQQTTRRVDTILNNYPINYYDLLPGKLREVTAEQVREVVAKYVRPQEMQIIVVGPASVVKHQIDSLASTLEVKPMPAVKKGRAAAGSAEDSMK